MQQNNEQQTLEQRIRTDIENLIDDSPDLGKQTVQDVLKQGIKALVTKVGGDLPDNPTITQVQEAKMKIERLRETIFEVLVDKKLVQGTYRSGTYRSEGWIFGLVGGWDWNGNLDKLSRSSIIQDEIAEIILAVTRKVIERVSVLEESISEISEQNRGLKRDITGLTTQNIKLHEDVSNLTTQIFRLQGNIDGLQQQNAREVNDLKKQNNKIIELLAKKLNVEEKKGEKKGSWVEREKSRSRNSSPEVI